jgi:hypothetical protein
MSKKKAHLLPEEVVTFLEYLGIIIAVGAVLYLIFKRYF